MELSQRGATFGSAELGASSARRDERFLIAQVVPVVPALIELFCVEAAFFFFFSSEVWAKGNNAAMFLLLSGKWPSQARKWKANTALVNIHSDLNVPIKYICSVRRDFRRIRKSRMMETSG